ncbi:MAG: type II toxin-antitoxin system VapC family toxin [Vicinamibacterales bacterium]
MSTPGVLVDSNVILDVLTNDRKWAKWSAPTLERAAESYVLIINPIIYAELLMGFTDRAELERLLAPGWFERRPVPWEASFLAARAFLRTRKRVGGVRPALPDFYIAAHAVVEDLTLLTRDPKRYQAHFREVKLMAP